MDIKNNYVLEQALFFFRLCSGGLKKATDLYPWSSARGARVGARPSPP